VVRTAVALVATWRATHPGDLPSDLLGIVSPFRAQCHAIRAALATELGEELAREIEVDTVDRFQGREKEAILVSLVARSWSDFVFDARRINVTLTRARTKVIVFGAKDLGRRMVETFARN
jgi:DNA replication ATP-dependent helicase Dna2